MIQPPRCAVAQQRLRHRLLHRRLLPVHLRDPAGDAPAHRPPRQPDRRRRDARRDRDHALDGRDRQWRPDPDRNPDRDRGRRGRLPPSADDRHAADGRALQRRGRRRRGADLLVGVPARLGRGREHPARHLRPDPVLHGDRLGLLLGIEHRLRQAPGDHPEPARSVPRPAHRQRAAPGRDPRRLHRPRHRPRLARRRVSTSAS